MQVMTLSPTRLSGAPEALHYNPLGSMLASQVHVRQQNSGGLISLTFLISPVYNKARLFAIRCRLSGRAAVRDVLQAQMVDRL